MQKELKKTSVRPDPAEPSAGLFDRIILAIKREQELYQTKRLLLIFFCLLIVSLGIAPFSWTVLVNQVKASGILYFVSVAIGNLDAFFLFWKDFSLAILGSLPIIGIIFFTINIALMVFAIRLFLHKKHILIDYLRNNFTSFNALA